MSTEEPPKVEKVQDGVFVDVHVGPTEKVVES